MLMLAAAPATARTSARAAERASNWFISSLGRIGVELKKGEENRKIHATQKKFRNRKEKFEGSDADVVLVVR